ncbi:MAG: hypothetical protein EOO27_13815 [Comamonadaceae bacterium]|nr:MAG: hypothetical protein EOO27_13815 [Comamonadaceae bacterium]
MELAKALDLVAVTLHELLDDFWREIGPHGLLPSLGRAMCTARVCDRIGLVGRYELFGGRIAGAVKQVACADQYDDGNGSKPAGSGGHAATASRRSTPETGQPVAWCAARCAPSAFEALS